MDCWRVDWMEVGSLSEVVEGRQLSGFDAVVDGNEKRDLGRVYCESGFFRCRLDCSDVFLR